MQMICISNPSDTDDALDGTVNISQTSPVFVLDVMFRIKMPETA